MLIFLAGLKNIPESLYEAADIDGAGTLSKFIHITLPSLSPVLFFNLIMGCIGALQVFDVAYIISTSMGGEAGGPEKSTYFYVLNLYVKSFNDLEIGTGSAMAWLFFLVILAITGVNFRAKLYWFPPEDERSRKRLPRLDRSP
jgi:multiple sugar transport system permease protein